MDFKDRFKGRTTTIRKEGVIDTFADPSKPIAKSQSNNQLASASKMPPSNLNDFHYVDTSPNPRQNTKQSFENKPPLPGFSSNAYSRSPANHSHNNKSQPPRMPSGSNNGSGVKSPYLVHNPFPALDTLDNHMNYNSQMVPQNRMEAMSYRNAPEGYPGNEFNPNSFYNQHSQYKGGMMGGPMGGPTPKGSLENQMNVGPMTNQMHKKNFENMSQQHKQMRMAEEALRGLESNYPNRMQSNRYEGYEQPPQNYNYPNYKPPLPMQGYNRDIHSNPVPNQNVEPNAFSFGAGNLTYQVERGRRYEDYPGGNIDAAKLGGQSKTSYKPYSIKDYKDVKAKVSVPLGGLGPNTHTDEWQKEKEKRDKMIEFSQNVKMFNAQRASNSEYNFKPKEKDKEKSRREIALEFAKNVPKPRQRRNSSPNNSTTGKQVESENTVSYGKGNHDLEEYEQRHLQYLSQLEKMKLA